MPKQAIKVIVGAAIAAAVGAVLGPGAFAAAFQRLFVQNVALGLISAALSGGFKSKSPSQIAQEARDNLQTVREPVSTRKVLYGTTRVGGSIVYLESTGSDNKYMHMVVAFAGHEVDGLEEIYFNDELAWSTAGYQNDYGATFELNWHNGDQTTADANLVSRSDSWTENHVLNGIAYAYIRLKYNRDKYPTGIPNITAKIRGKKVYDPRTGVTAFSNNPALCIRDYLTDTKYGMSATAAELNDNSFIAAANLCEESVELDAGGTQQRFTLDGVVDTANNRGGILEAMLTSLGGSLIYSGGEFFLYGSAYRIPTITLDESVVVAPIEIQTKRSRRDLFNGVKGVFNSQADNYVLTDYPAVSNATYASEDGEAVYLDVDLPYTVDPARAQRIAKLSLLRSRQQIAAKVTCNLSALRIKAGDTVMINNERMGWSSKVFEVTNLMMAADNEGRLTVELNLIETDAAVYDWTTSDEAPFTAGLPTTLPAPGAVSPPYGVSITATTFIADDGTARPALDIDWTNGDAFATQFEVAYSKDGGLFKSVITNETQYRLEDVEVGASYTIKVRAINRLGARSVFTDGSITGTGDTTPPAVPTGLTATGSIRSIVLDWTNPTDLDFDVINIYENTVDDFGTATKVVTIRGDNFTRAGLGVQVTRYYWITAEDRTGNESAQTASVNATTSTIDTVDLSTAVQDSITIAQQYGINPVDTIVGLTGDQDDQMVFNRADNSIYRWDATAEAWTNTLYTDVADGYITTDMVAANAIVASKISVTDLSAISADVGTITAGILSDSNSRVQLNLDNEYLTMVDAGAVERLRIGNDGSNNYIVQVSDGTNTTTLTPGLGTLIASGTTTISTSSGLNGNNTIGNAISLGGTFDFDDLDVLVTIKGYRPMQLNYWAYYGTNFPNAPGIWSKYDLPLGPSGTYKYYTQSGTDGTTGRPTYTQNTSIGQYTSGSVQALYYDSLMYHSAYAFWEKGTQTSASEVFITAYVRHRHYENDTSSARWLYETANSIEVEYAIIAKNYTG